MGKPKKTRIVKYVYSDVVSLVNRYAGDKKRVLEIGCGTGNNLIFFAENGFKTYGIDLDRDAISYAKKLLEGKNLKAELKIGDAKNLPYKNNSFDLILDRACLQHNKIEDIKIIIKQIERILKVGGILLIINIRSKKDSVSKDFKKADTFKYYNYVHFTDEKELKGLLKNFKIIYFEHRICDITVPKKERYASYILAAEKLK